MRVHFPLEYQPHHPVSVPESKLQGRELGRAIACLRFDCIIQVVLGFIEELSLQQKADRVRGRHKLANILALTQKHAVQLNAAIKQALEISRPHMQHEFQNEPER